ncbi:hypothetical protein BGZ72_003212, partial [Mortierella alpina]
NWDDEEEPAITDPEPHHSPAEDYTTYTAQLQGPAEDTGQDETDDGSDFKTIAIPFNKIVRPDVSSGDSGMILRLLEDAQAGISKAMEELYNLAFCVTLAVAAGYTEPREVETPLPSVDIKNLIPQSFELREDLNPIVHIAPFSAETQHGIENGPK